MKESGRGNKRADESQLTESLNVTRAYAEIEMETETKTEAYVQI